MAPVRDATTSPCRPLPGRGRGRLPIERKWPVQELAPPPLFPPVARLERTLIDYGALEAAMLHRDEVVRFKHRSLQASGLGG